MSLFAAIQMSSGVDLEANLAVAKRWLEAAAAAKAAVALLPENFNFLGGRESQKREMAEVYGAGPTQSFLSDRARALGLWIIAGTLPLRTDAADGRVTNSSLVFNDRGECVARYDKIHLFDVDVPGKPGESYRESHHVAPGNRTVVVDTPAGRVGLSVCYDMRFPELYRRLSAEGAEILVMPAAFTVPTGRAHWETLLRARAIETQTYVVAAAQAGVHNAKRTSYGALPARPGARCCRE